jgi:hypothetical protein
VNEGADRNVNEGADRNVNEAVSTELLTVVALIDKIDVFGRRPSLARPVLQVGPPQTCKAAAIFALIWGFEFRVKRAMPSTPLPQISTGDAESEGLSSLWDIRSVD